MRIEVGEHAGNGIGDHLLVFDRLDIALLDGAVDLGEGAQLVNGQAGFDFLVGQRRKVQADQGPGDESADGQADGFRFAHFKLAHFIGSIGCPWWRSSKYKPDSGLPPLLPTVATVSPPFTLCPTCLSKESLLP